MRQLGRRVTADRGTREVGARRQPGQRSMQTGHEAGRGTRSARGEATAEPYRSRGPALRSRCWFLRRVASTLRRSAVPSDLRFARSSVRLALSVSLPRVLLVCCPVSVRLRLVPLVLASCSSSSRILIVCSRWYSPTVSPPLVLAHRLAPCSSASRLLIVVPRPLRSSVPDRPVVPPVFVSVLGLLIVPRSPPSSRPGDFVVMPCGRHRPHHPVPVHVTSSLRNLTSAPRRGVAPQG